MKYQTRILLYYSVVALLFGVVIGCLVYRINLTHGKAAREKSLQTDADQLVSQMEDRLDRMDAIMNYILSDPGTVDDIKTLGMVSEGTIPSLYELSARADIRTVINTDYILRNSYRSFFYNREGELISSFVRGSLINLTGDFKIENNTHIAQADAAGGKNILIPPHPDLYIEGREEVFSLLKALQGKNMGYLEVESTTESLAGLNLSDTDAMFLVTNSDGELLYAKTGEDEEALADLTALSLEMDKESYLYTEKFLAAKAVSDHYGVTVITAVPDSVLRKDAAPYVQAALIGSLIIILGTLIIIVLISFVVVKPVKKLTAMIDETTLDSLADLTKVNVQEGGIDEMQMLSDSFSAMKERLGIAIRSEKRASELQLQAQFDTLQAQVNPHFLYNVLNIISARGVMADDETICEMCGALAAMLRYSTSNKERKATIRMEILYLQHYIFLMKQRYDGRLSVDIEIDEGLMDIELPKMTLQQLVENSVKHGFANVTGPMHVTITGRKSDDRWSVTVCDNGEGFSREKIVEIRESMDEIREHLLQEKAAVEMEIGGMGLANTYARCLLYFGPSLIFEIRNCESGAVVEIGSSLIKEE